MPDDVTAGISIFSGALSNCSEMDSTKAQVGIPLRVLSPNFPTGQALSLNSLSSPDRVTQEINEGLGRYKHVSRSPGHTAQLLSP